MYLDRLLGTTTKVRVLSLFTANPSLELIERELAERAGCSQSEANRQLSDLVGAGVLSMTKRGRSKVYSANTKHFLFRALTRLFRDLNDVYREAAGKVAAFAGRKFSVEAVILAGSAATRSVRDDYVRSPSDIDLVIVCKSARDADRITKETVGFAASKIFEEYGVNCHPITISSAEYRRRLKERDSLITDAHTTGVVLYGKRPARTR